MAGCCQKQSLQPPLSYCFLQCDVLQGGEWIMTQERVQAQNMPAWKNLAERMNGSKDGMKKEDERESRQARRNIVFAV